MNPNTSKPYTFGTSVTAKLFFVGFLTLIIWGASSVVLGLVSERQGRQFEVEADIARSWGSEQVVAGPVLVIPYTRFQSLSRDPNVESPIDDALVIFPNILSTEAVLMPQVRSRGIFDVVVYDAAFSASGAISVADVEKRVPEGSVVHWEDAQVSVLVSDTRGITEEVTFVWNDKEYALGQGEKTGVRGIDERVSLGARVPLVAGQNVISFAFEMPLRGVKTFSVLPVGKSTTASLTGAWGSPSFVGAYAPGERVVSEEGFEATWSVTSFDQSLRGDLLGNEWQVSLEGLAYRGFGVELLQPVDFYQQVERSVKYAILFIVLTFMAFFLFETLGGLRIHPLQYLLVGFALALFYLLLLSFAERIGFGGAYLLATIMITGIITGYCRTVLGARKRALGMAALLLGLYGYLYVLLRLEDVALLAGSLLLFVVLAVVMYITRNVDWYAVRIGKGE